MNFLLATPKQLNIKGMKRLIIAILILGLCTTASSQGSGKEKVNVWGNTNSSLKQGGRVAYQDGIVYYANPRDSFKLYRINIDGTLKRRISHDIPEQINVIGQHIYYLNRNYDSGKQGLYRISITGRDRLFYDLDASYLRVHNSGMAYFLLDGKFYQINTNNITKPKELVFVEKDYITGAYITTDYVFYTKWWENLSANTQHGGMHIYGRVSGKKDNLLSDNRVITEFIVSDNWRWVFYRQMGGYYDNNSKQYVTALILVSNNNRNPKKMPTPLPEYDNNIAFIDRWLYFRSATPQDNTLYRMSFDGKNVEVVSQLPGEVYEAGDYLICYDGKYLVRTLKDGRLAEKLN